MLKITSVNKYYVVDIGDNRIHMLNQKSLVYFLRDQVGFNKAAVNSILNVFNHESTVTIDLNNTERKVV